MGARKKRQYESGEASNFVSRKQAMRKLQLNLKVGWIGHMLVLRSAFLCQILIYFLGCFFQDFRRLCILKGIHPREPRNRKRAQKGDMTKIQTMFHEKDIRFLLHEPIVWKFRDFKVINNYITIYFLMRLIPICVLWSSFYN